jgi:hypothetical protein
MGIFQIVKHNMKILMCLKYEYHEEEGGGTLLIQEASYNYNKPYK